MKPIAGIEPGWTDPFAFRRVVKVDRQSHTVYTLGELGDFFGVSAICGGDPPAFAWADWISEEAARLAALAKAGMKDIRWEPVTGPYGEPDFTAIEVDPLSRLIEKEWLKGHGYRMSQRAADRGTLTEKLLDQWADCGYLAPDDVRDWLDYAITEPRDDGKPYTCDAEDVLPYVLCLRDWLDEFKGEIVGRNVLVYHPELKYATVVDFQVMLDGKPYSVNLKTSASASRSHALQAYMEAVAPYALPAGSDKPVQRGVVWPALLYVGPGKKATFRTVETERMHDYMYSAISVFQHNLAEMPLKTVATTTNKEKTKA